MSVVCRDFIETSLTRHMARLVIPKEGLRGGDDSTQFQFGKLSQKVNNYVGDGVEKNNKKKERDIRSGAHVFNNYYLFCRRY